MFNRRSVLLGMGSVSMGAALSLTACDKADPKTTISFANPAPVWWNAVPLLAANRKAFEMAGVTVLSFDVPTGTKSKEEIVNGNAMMGVCALNAISITPDDQLQDLRVLGSIMQSSSTVAIVARRPLGELARLKIGYVPGAISEFYLIAYLQKAGLLDLYHEKRIALTAMPPSGLTTALAKRDVDAIAAWEPFATQGAAALREAGETAFIERDQKLYTQHILILARATADPTASGKVVQALRRVCADISANRQAAAVELEKYFRFPPGFLSNSQVWNKVDFTFSADAEMIASALARDLELAEIAGIAKATAASFPILLSKLN